MHAMCDDNNAATEACGGELGHVNKVRPKGLGFPRKPGCHSLLLFAFVLRH